MAEAAAPAAAGLEEWEGVPVPAIVAQACRAPYRGQPKLGPRAHAVLKYFDEKVVLEAPRKNPFEALRPEDLKLESLKEIFNLDDEWIRKLLLKNAAKCENAARWVAFAPG